MKKSSRLKTWLTAGALSFAQVVSSGCIGDTHISKYIREPVGRIKENRGIRDRELGQEYCYSLITKQANNTLEIMVNESVNRVIGREQEIIEKEGYARYAVGTKEVDNPGNPVQITGSILACIGLLGSISSDKDAGTAFDVLLGAGLGIGLGGIFIGKREPYKERIGKVEYQIIPGTSQYELVVGTEKIPVSENLPAGDIPVRVSSNNLSFLNSRKVVVVRTDMKGKANISMDENIPYWSFTKTGLEEELKQNLAGQVTPKYLDSFVEDILKYTEKGKITHPTTIATFAESREGRVISNDSKTIDVAGVEIDPSIFQSVVREWVDNYINSKIKNVRILTKDKLSHARILNAVLELDVTAPSREELVKFYFSGKLKDIAVLRVNRYLTGKSDLETDAKGVAVFPVYLGSKVNFEVAHGDYQFQNDECKFDENNLEYTIRMIDKGQKVRVKEVKE